MHEIMFKGSLTLFLGIEMRSYLPQPPLPSSLSIKLFTDVCMYDYVMNLIMHVDILKLMKFCAVAQWG